MSDEEEDNGMFDDEVITDDDGNTFRGEKTTSEFIRERVLRFERVVYVSCLFVVTSSCWQESAKTG